MNDSNIQSFELAQVGIRFSLSEKQTYTIKICGLDITVHPQVFSPKYFRGVEQTNSEFPFIENQSFLEVGCGVGLTSILAAKHHNRVVSTDINPYAVECTADNAERNQVSHLVDVREGDIFSAIGKDETFDTIYWNLPYIFVPEDFCYRNLLEKSVCDPGYQCLEKYIRQAPDYLNEGGRILIGFGSHGDMGKFESIAHSVHFGLELLSSIENNTGVKLQLFQLV